METLRRALIVLFTITAITAWFEPANTLYLIEHINFKHKLEHHPYPWKHNGNSVSQYVEEETKNRLHSVSKAQWQKVSSGIESSASGFVKANNQTILPFITHFSLQMPMIYLKTEEGDNFISIRRLFPGDYSFQQAPGNYQKPYYLYSPFLLLAGILFYIFLPRYQFSDDTLHYGAGFRAVIGPDIVGLSFISGFYALGLGVGLSGSSGGILTLFPSNLILITFVLWSFTLFGFYMLYTGTRYAALGLHCSSEQIKRFSIVDVEIISLRNIDSVKLGHWKASKWVIRLGFLVSLFNWRALGPALLNNSRNDPLLEIHLKDGRIWSYDLAGVQNIEKVLLCLQKNRIDVDPKLIKIIF